MLTTIIYRSHICDNAPIKTLEDMVAAANITNGEAGVTGILLFNGTHFFQLLEGPHDSVTAVFQLISQDPRHFNLVELLRDYAPKRRFGKAGMELFDLRRYDRDDVLQTVLDKGTTQYQLTYDDRALQFFRSFVEGRDKEGYFEIPPGDTWEFIIDGSSKRPEVPVVNLAADCSFAFQPLIDPLSQEVIALEALLRTPSGASSQYYFAGLSNDEIYRADLTSKHVAFAMAAALDIGLQTLSVNLLPMTLVNIPDAVAYLLQGIRSNGLIPEQIIIEFTESEVISRLDIFTDAVRQLKAAGIRVAIDQFGAGFAGLQLLAQFQPDRIKINRDLIANVNKSGPQQAIIQAIIKCCISLENIISAVDVESPEEWMWLESAGISQFQGSLFAGPELGGIPAIAWPEKRLPF